MRITDGRRRTEVRLRSWPPGRTLGSVANRTSQRAAGPILLALVVCLAVSTMLAPLPAAGAADEPVLVRRAQRHGDCEERSTWKLTIRPSHPGMWRLRLRITTGRAGERWNLFMNRNGELLFSRRRTSDFLGDVTTRVEVNRPGCLLYTSPSPRD